MGRACTCIERCVGATCLRHAWPCGACGGHGHRAHEHVPFTRGCHGTQVWNDGYAAGPGYSQALGFNIKCMHVFCARVPQLAWKVRSMPLDSDLAHSCIEAAFASTIHGRIKCLSATHPWCNYRMYVRCQTYFALSHASTAVHGPHGAFCAISCVLLCKIAVPSCASMPWAPKCKTRHRPGIDHAACMSMHCPWTTCNICLHG